MMYRSTPAQLSKKQFRITTATKKRTRDKAEESLYDLIDSKTVLPCYKLADPSASLSQGKGFSTFKLYVSDTGLFVTLMFLDRPVIENTIYAKLLFG